MSTPIKMSTDLLAAIAKFAYTGRDKPIGAVAFQPTCIVATDGHRLVRVPREFSGEAFGVWRSDLLAAVAAQDAVARDDWDPKIGHDLLENQRGDLALTDGPRGSREIEIRRVEPNSIAMAIGHNLVLSSAGCALESYPPVDQVFEVRTDDSEPDGYLVNPEYLEGIATVNNASAGYTHGVRVTRWSRLKNGKRGPLVLENAVGIRFAIMPQRDNGAAS